MAKLWNTSKDGVIFINFLKPLVKAVRTAPGPAKLIVLGIAAAIGAGYGLYRLSRNNKQEYLRMNSSRVTMKWIVDILNLKLIRRS